jgi:hypothetical protein
VQLRVGGARAVTFPPDDERDVTGRIRQAEERLHVRPVDGHHEAVMDIAGCDSDSGDLVEQLDADEPRRVVWWPAARHAEHPKGPGIRQPKRRTREPLHTHVSVAGGT